MIINATSPDYYKLTNTNFSNVKLAMFMACNTSPMAQYAYDNGADAAIGFHYKVLADDMALWSPRVTLKLSQGYTLTEAVKYADGFEDYDSNTISKHRVDGGSITITSGSRSLMSSVSEIKVVEEAEDGTEIVKTVQAGTDNKEAFEPIFFTVESPLVRADGSEKVSVDAISDYILANIDPYFDINRFKVYEIINDKDCIVKLTYMVDGYVTDVGYTAFIYDGRLTDISKCGDINYNMTIIEDSSARSLPSQADEDIYISRG